MSPCSWQSWTLICFSWGTGWGRYLRQLGLEARLLCQCVIDGLQEAPLHHIEGLEAEDKEAKASSNTTVICC